MDGRNIIKRTLTVLGVVIVVGYSFFVADDFLRGPRIIADTPVSGTATTTPHIAIAGRVVHVNALFINDTPISFDLKGRFADSLLLAEGYNIMTVRAIDRYGRSVRKEIEVTLLPVATTTVNNL